MHLIPIDRSASAVRIKPVGRFSEPHGEHNDGLINCVTDCFKFCVDKTKDLSTFSLTTTPGSPKKVEKEKTFRSGDREIDKRVQRQVSVRISEEKDAYSRLEQNNSSEVWRDMKTIIGIISLAPRR